jgi:hypothetical protein
MLQLLLERGQSYADLASLLAVDEAEVRTRARAALTELAGADPDRNVGLTDYLLGQADPIGRADAVRHLKDDPDDLALATEVTQKIRLIAPNAELPRLPGEERRPRPPGRSPVSRLPIPKRLRREPAGGDKEPAAPRTTLSRRQTQLIVGLGSAAVLIVAVVLGITGAFSGSGSANTVAATTTTSSTTGTSSTASGQPQGYPLTPLSVSSSGRLSKTYAIPSAFQPILPKVQALYVTLAKDTVVTSTIQQAVKNKQLILPVEGQTAFAGVPGKAQGKVVPIKLQAAKGVQGSAVAAIGVASGNQPFLKVTLNNVKAPPKGQTYIAWFVLGLSK